MVMTMVTHRLMMAMTNDGDGDGDAYAEDGRVTGADLLLSPGTR